MLTTCVPVQWHAHMVAPAAVVISPLSWIWPTDCIFDTPVSNRQADLRYRFYGLNSAAEVLIEGCYMSSTMPLAIAELSVLLLLIP